MLASGKVNLNEAQRSWGNGRTGFPTQKGKPNAPGIHVRNKCLLLFKDGGTRQWEQRPRMRGKVGFGQLLNILSDNYMKVLSRRRHAHSRKGSVTVVWTECAKVALDICKPTELDLE